MKTFLAFLVAAFVVVFSWYLAADRHTPFTSNARVRAYVSPVVPEVSGTVIEVAAENGVIMAAGSTLVRIDDRPFEIERQRASANLKLAMQDVGAQSADVERAQADLARAHADLENARIQTARVFELEKKGLVALTRADSARTKLANAVTAVDASQANLTAVQERLGDLGEDNANVQAALASLASADLNLERTTLYAPSNGAIVGLDVSEGVYAKAGQTLMTFVDTDDVWIEAYFTENNLGRMSLGDRAEVALDIHPGRVLDGRVHSFSGGVSIGSTDRAGEMQSVPRTTGWMRDPQRFPVRIILPGYRVETDDDDVLMQFNGQADLVVYTGSNALLNTLGAAWIRLNSWISYVY